MDEDDIDKILGSCSLRGTQYERDPVHLKRATVVKQMRDEIKKLKRKGFRITYSRIIRAKKGSRTGFRWVLKYRCP